MNNQKDGQEFRALIGKYLDGKINGEEVERLVNYYESFQKSHEWVEELGSENTIKDNVLKNLEATGEINFQINNNRITID